MNKKGFTLIELLVAMTIIAVLAGLALVSFQGARKTARDGKRKADLEQIRSGLEMCRNDSGSYVVGTSLPGSGSCSGYLSPLPTDPISTRLYAYSSADGITYTLCAALEIGGGSVSGCGDCGDSACNYKVSPP